MRAKVSRFISELVPEKPILRNTGGDENHFLRVKRRRKKLWKEISHIEKFNRRKKAGLL